MNSIILQTHWQLPPSVFSLIPLEVQVWLKIKVEKQNQVPIRLTAFSYSNCTHQNLIILCSYYLTDVWRPYEIIILSNSLGHHCLCHCHAQVPSDPGRGRVTIPIWGTLKVNWGQGVHTPISPSSSISRWNIHFSAYVHYFKDWRAHKLVLPFCWCI